MRRVMIDRNRQFGMVGQNMFPTAAQSLWLHSLEIEFDKCYPPPYGIVEAGDFDRLTPVSEIRLAEPESASKRRLAR